MAGEIGIVDKLPIVRKERIPVRGLKHYFSYPGFSSLSFCQKRTNPREGIETHAPFKSCLRLELASEKNESP